jgi:hypothetical protein
VPSNRESTENSDAITVNFFGHAVSTREPAFSNTQNLTSFYTLLTDLGGSPRDRNIFLPLSFQTIWKETREGVYIRSPPPVESFNFRAAVVETSKAISAAITVSTLLKEHAAYSAVV